MHHVNLPMEMQYQLFGGIFTTVTVVDGLTVIELNGKHMACYNHFFGEMPGFDLNLHTVGEAGTIKLRQILHQNWRTTVYTVCLLGTL